MINGTDIFYMIVNKRSGLEIIENKSGNGLTLTSNRGKG